MLCKAGVDCTYGLISAAAHLVPQVSVLVSLCLFLKLFTYHDNEIDFNTRRWENPCDFEAKKLVLLQADLLIMGCWAILSNGKAVVAPGGGQVAMHAQANNIPVLIAAPTYRFVDKVCDRDVYFQLIEKRIPLCYEYNSCKK